jgi:hypothetical protein
MAPTDLERDTMKFSPNGIPILTLDQKLAALVDQLNRGYYENAASHLCDLLEICRQKIVTHEGMMFVDLKAMIRKYGSNPTPVEGVPNSGVESD